MMYRLSFQLSRQVNGIAAAMGMSPGLDYTLTDEDPVNVIERAMLVLENERDELLAKREPKDVPSPRPTVGPYRPIKDQPQA